VTRDLTNAEWLTPREAVEVFGRYAEYWIALARVRVEYGGIYGTKHGGRWSLERESIHEWLAAEPELMTFEDHLAAAKADIRRASAGAGSV